MTLLSNIITYRQRLTLRACSHEVEAQVYDNSTMKSRLARPDITPLVQCRLRDNPESLFLSCCHISFKLLQSNNDTISHRYWMPPLFFTHNEVTTMKNLKWLPGPLGFALSATALAATGEPSNTNTSNITEVIVVTAQKREQEITDVPMAMSAYSGEFLEKIGGSELNRVAELTPGFVMQLQDRFRPGFSIRGITTDELNPESELRVAIFQDGVAVTHATASYGELFDIDRIEVEKGPQSTLHGRSALNGGVSIFQKKPLFEQVFEVKGGLGEYGYQHVQAVANTPLSDTMAVRFGALTKEKDGFVEDSDGSGSFNAVNVEAYRLGVLWEPSDDLRFHLSTTYDLDDTSGGVPFKSGTFLPLDQSTGKVIGDLDFWTPTHLETFGELPKSYFEREIRGVSGTTEYTISDRFTLTSITGYRWFESCQAGDNDGTPTNIIAYEQCASGEQLSEEVRVNFTDIGPFNGFVGVGVFDAQNDMSLDMGYDERAMSLLLTGQLQAFAPRGLTNAEINSMLGDSANSLKAFHLDRQVRHADIRTYDLFADVTSNLTDNLEIFIGGRMTWDRKEVSLQGTTPYGVSSLTGSGLLLGPTPGNQKYSDSNSSSTATGRVGLRYEITPNLNWYAVYGLGKRPEVVTVNTNGTSSLIPTEELTSMETGIKFQLLDGRVVGDSSIYYYEYENFQTLAAVEGRLVTVNAGEADSTGFEAQVNYLATDSLSLFGSYGYNKARLRTGAYKDNSFRNSPDHMFSVGASFEWPLQTGVIAFSPVYSWQSKMFFFDDNDKAILQQRTPAAFSDTKVDEFQGAFGLFSARLSYTSADEAWMVAIVGDNLTDEKYIVDAGNMGDYFGIPTFIAGSRQNVRAEFTVNF